MRLLFSRIRIIAWCVIEAGGFHHYYDVSTVAVVAAVTLSTTNIAVSILNSSFALTACISGRRKIAANTYIHDTV